MSPTPSSPRPLSAERARSILERRRAQLVVMRERRRLTQRMYEQAARMTRRSSSS